MTLHIWIGYDEREQVASDVCAHSIESRTRMPVEIHHLKHRDLRNSGLFRREWRVDAKGQYWDISDQRPFSTQFSHSRFLVPELARRKDIRDWVMFVDCDFVFREDIANLTADLDPANLIYCVQQQHESERKTKMDGMMQPKYRCKNWSSLMLFNMDLMPKSMLKPDYVNDASGSSMHGFDWLAGYHAGSLDMKWNQLVGEYPIKDEGALHFTNGGPWLHDMEAKTGDETIWLDEYKVMIGEKTSLKPAYVEIEDAA